MRLTNLMPSHAASLIAALLLAACATPVTPTAPAAAAPAASEEADHADEGSADNAEVAKPAAEDESRLPKQALTREILFGILIGDLAAQHGDVPLAADTWLELAKRTQDPRVAQRALELGLMSGRYDNALHSAEIWHSTDPESARAKETLLSLHIAGNRLADAEAELAQWLKDEPADAAPIFLHMHSLWQKQTDKQQVYALTKRLAAGYASLPESHVAIAMAAVDADRPTEAEAACDSALKLKPDWVAVMLYRASITGKRSPDEGVSYLRGVHAKYPQSADVQLALARAEADTHHFQEARSLYTALAQQNPTDIEFPVGEALADIQLHDFQAAQTALERALQLKPSRTGALYYHLGLVTEEQGKLVEARTAYQQVNDPDYKSQIALRLARINAKMGDRDAALAQVALLPNDTPADQVARIQAEAQVWETLKDFDHAKTVLDAGLAKHVDNADLLYDRSLILDHLGDIAQAESDLRRYLVLNPDSPLALNALGYTLANRTERFDEAETLIRQALSHEPDNPVIQDSLGWVLVRRGNLREGAEWLGKAFAAMPDPEIAAHYGEALWRSGKQNEARRVWAEGKKLDPSHDVLGETVHRLTGQ